MVEAIDVARDRPQTFCRVLLARPEFQRIHRPYHANGLAIPISDCRDTYERSLGGCSCSKASRHASDSPKPGGIDPASRGRFNPLVPAKTLFNVEVSPRWFVPEQPQLQFVLMDGPLELQAQPFAGPRQEHSDAHPQS